MSIKTFHLLNRVTFGPRPEDILYVDRVGWKQYVKEQLHPGGEHDELEQMIREGEFGWRFDFNGEARQSMAKLSYYHLPIGDIYDGLSRMTGSTQKYYLRRPFYETLVVSWLKAMHSPWQLRELMVEFWHDHFTVSADIEDGIASCMAAYDRQTIRPNVLGNFRTLLEEVAKAPAMLHYLDNAESRASPANENYARELFELHTLGAENYYNHLYDDWKQVPGALDGKAEGYIDEDVYEAARAFSGWTVAISQPDKVLSLKDNGEFHYFDLWHDPYKKRILGIEFPSHQGPMEDGRRVLDLLAYHPKTAHFVCTKLCRWLVADSPPESLVAKAVAIWMEHSKSPDQIGKTVETILFSQEFEESLGDKLKRPNHLVFSFVRMTGAKLTPHESVFWWLRNMGYHQFTCPFPTGNPMEANHWLNSDAMLKRWQSFPELENIGSEEGFFAWDILDELPEGINDFGGLADYWGHRLLYSPLPKKVRKKLEKVFFEDLDYDSLSSLRDRDPSLYGQRVKQMVKLICMSPEFQKR